MRHHRHPIPASTRTRRPLPPPQQQRRHRPMPRIARCPQQQTPPPHNPPMSGIEKCLAYSTLAAIPLLPAIVITQGIYLL